MNAAYVEKLGPADNIIYGKLPVPTVNDNQVLIKTEAFAVNPIDIILRSGKYTHLNLPLPYIIGRDFVGKVDKVGKNVHNLKLGQKVWGINQGINGRQGTFSEYVSVDSIAVFPLPENVNINDAVALVSSAIAVVVGLIRAAELKENDIIFVNGGAGNVGSAIVSIAKARGAQVIASTEGKEKIEWVKSLGASHVIDYKKEDVGVALKKLVPEGVNVFWDTSRQPNFNLFIESTRKRGRIVLMSGPDAHPEFPVGPFYNKDLILAGFSINNASFEELQPYAEIVNTCLAQNILKVKIAKVFPLAQAKEAQKAVEMDKSIWGRVVVTV